MLAALNMICYSPVRKQLETLTLLTCIRRSSGRLSMRHKLSSTYRGQATVKDTNNIVITFDSVILLTYLLTKHNIRLNKYVSREPELADSKCLQVHGRGDPVRF